MPFNNDKNGYQNETAFIKKLNNKEFKKVDYGLQLFLEDIFDNVKNDDRIICFRNPKPQKYDIFIKVNGITKRISIKKGVKNSVHAEDINDFIVFLKYINMPKYMINNFLKYHFADGTTNGSGNHRISATEYKKEHQHEIDEINAFINKNDILIKAIDRFVIQGRNSIDKIDAILYGVPEDFIWIKRNDIYNILLLHKYKYSTSIHFSDLTYQPLDRCLNNNPKYEKNRYKSQIKWYNISDDIIENMGINSTNQVYR